MHDRSPPFVRLLLLSLITLGACDRNEVVVHAQEECPVVLHAGQTLELRLTSNPSTGFSWELRDAAASALRSLGEPAFVAESRQAGSGGESVYRFEALPGEGHLSLAYRRVWETGVAPSATFECDVRVRE